MAPGHVYSMPFKWVSQSRSCLLTQWIEYIFKYANGIFEIIWDTLLLLQISCSKYLHQSRYPRYDVNYLKILLGSLYPNVIQIFALKYTKIFPSLPTWKFISVTFPVHNSWHRGGIWNVSLWIIYIKNHHNHHLMIVEQCEVYQPGNLGRWRGQRSQEIHIPEIFPSKHFDYHHCHKTSWCPKVRRSLKSPW